MAKQSQVSQHLFERASDIQFREFLLEMRWESDHFDRDYGEDYVVRIFEKGNYTGQLFLVQLKSTDDITKLRLKNGDFRYQVEIHRLRQWQRSCVPVLFILWDIKNRCGFFVKASDPLITSSPDKRQKTEKARLATIYIPAANKIQRGESQRFSDIVKNSFEARVYKQDSSELAKLRYELAEAQAQADSEPSSYKSQLKLAAAHYKLHDFANALKAVNRAWGIDQIDKDVLQVRASILVEYAVANKGPKHLFHEAIKLFELTRLSEEEFGITDFNIGNCYVGLGDYANALTSFDRALLQGPKPHLRAQILNNRGTTLMQLGREEDAHTALQEATTTDVTLWEPHASIAEIMLHREKFAEARDSLNAAFAINPNLNEIGYSQLYCLAYSYAKLEDELTAYTKVNQLLQIKPDHIEGQQLKVFLTLKLWNDNDIESKHVVEFFEHRLIDNPDDDIAANALNFIYLSQSHSDEIRATYAGAIRAGSKNPQLIYRYAKILQRDGRTAEAIQILEAAVSLHNEHAIAHALADLQKEAGEYSRAIYFYKIAMSNSSNPISFLRDIADCYYFLGDHKMSLSYLARIILIDSRNSSAWNNIQFALQELGAVVTLNKIGSVLFDLRNGLIVPENRLTAAIDRLMAELQIIFGNQFVEDIHSPPHP